MKKRVLTGVIGIIIFMPFIVFSQTLALVLATLALSLVGVYEMLKCTGNIGKLIITVPSFLVTAAAQILPRLWGGEGELYTSVMLMIYISYAVLLMMGAVFSKGSVKIADAAISAMFPPAAASGLTCPIAAPRVAPEKRPSVIRATELPRPMPMMEEVGFSISRMPGPPLGPS